MSTETQPSEHAMRAAAALDTNLYLSAEARQCALRNAARAIDQHAIAPAVAERDRRIAELVEVLHNMISAHMAVYPNERWACMEVAAKKATAILAKHGVAHE